MELVFGMPTLHTRHKSRGDYFAHVKFDKKRALAGTLETNHQELHLREWWAKEPPDQNEYSDTDQKNVDNEAHCSNLLRKNVGFVFLLMRGDGRGEDRMNRVKGRFKPEGAKEKSKGRKKKEIKKAKIIRLLEDHSNKKNHPQESISKDAYLKLPVH